jgi:two-component system chemotaxis response regulator CheB
VAIGVSTGGPTALAAVIPALPADLRVPVVIVQHMPPMFTGFLADRLQKQTPLKVLEAKEGSRVEPGTILIAPGDFHMCVRTNGTSLVTRLNQAPPENSCRPAVDVLFRSVAEVFGDAAIGVVLTGMGQDGLRGAEILRLGGAYIIAQDEASSVVWGMPGAVVRADLADAVVGLPEIVPEILRHL